MNLIPEWMQTQILEMNREHFRKRSALVGEDSSWVDRMSDEDFMQFLREKMLGGKSDWWTELPRIGSVWFDKQCDQTIRVHSYHVEHGKQTRILILFKNGNYPYDIGSEWLKVWTVRFSEELA